MNSDEVGQLLSTGLPGCRISVSGADSHFQIEAVGDCFEGLSAVKRQQAVYAVLGEAIRDGRIHAVNIRAMTPAEHDARH